MLTLLAIGVVLAVGIPLQLHYLNKRRQKQYSQYQPSQLQSVNARPVTAQAPAKAAIQTAKKPSAPKAVKAKVTSTTTTPKKSSSSTRSSRSSYDDDDSYSSSRRSSSYDYGSSSYSSYDYGSSDSSYSGGGSCSSSSDSGGGGGGCD